MRRLALLLAICACALSAQTKKILVDNSEPGLAQELAAVSPKARIGPVTAENVMREIGDADAYVGDITPVQVRAGKHLQWVQVMSAGVENVLFLSGGNDLRDSNIALTNNKIVQGPEIADHAMAMLLMLTRRLRKYVDDDLHETWDGAVFTGIELRGKTAVVIGAGGIGNQIAARAWAFGMNVIGVDPEDKPYSPFMQKVVKPDQLDEVLPQADVVFVSAPHTEKSHKMMGAREFELMKPKSYFVAVSPRSSFCAGSAPARMRMRAVSTRCPRAACISAVVPKRFARFGSAPALSSTRTASTSP